MSNITTPNNQFQYQIQGQYELRIEGRMMISRVCGPWNIHAVNAYRDAAERIIQALSGAPWVLLAVLSGEPLHTAESIDELAEMIRGHRQLGRCGTALVFEGPIALARIHQLMLSKMYIMSGEPHYFANDEASALLWLERQLAA
ncbi:hypothetical protein [Undibacterium sp. RuRC25W]|uniref:hypothetical protein n=1 Tax=Undibacterium sp. RuRC25W TaxID=3413047 RepID=UPI003BF2C35F